MNWIVPLLCLCCASASAAELSFVANLDGAQEVPSNASAGSGFAVASVSDQGTLLRIAYTWRDLGTGLTAAHIHGPAAIGVNAGIVFNLTPPTGSTSGEVLEREFALDPTQFEQLRQGLWYVNMHTAGFSGGEIRGQLVPAAATSARLEGAQEVPPVQTGASGTGRVVINAAGDLMWVGLAWSGLSGTTTGAHIHGPAARGTNAGILFNLAPSTGEDAGRLARFFPVVADDTDELLAALWYFNVHSTLFSGGEIRGQIEIVHADGFEP